MCVLCFPGVYDKSVRSFKIESFYIAPVFCLKGNSHLQAAQAGQAGSGFSVPGMVFSLPEVLFSRIWVFSSHGVSSSRWCFQFPSPWVCGSHCGVFRYHVGV